MTAMSLVSLLVILFILFHNFGSSSNHLPVSLVSFLSESQVEVSNETNSFYATERSASRRCDSHVLHTTRHNVADYPVVNVIVYAGQSRKVHPGFSNFKTSLSLAGYQHVTVIEPPQSTLEINKYTHANYSGEALFWKERLEKFYQETLRHKNDSLLLFCDAFDSLVTQPPNILVNRFYMFGSDIVFSTEILCDTVSCRRDLWLRDFFKEIAPKSSPYKYINAGMFMGRASALRMFMLCAMEYANDGRDDQSAFSHCFRRYHASYNFSVSNTGQEPLASLDYNSILFGNLPPVSDFFDLAWDFQTSRADAKYEIFEIPFLYRKHNMKTPLTSYPLYYSPVVIHFPGISYRPYLRKQWFNPCQQFLKWRYNEIGQTIFKSGRTPHLAYSFISKTNNRGSMQDSDTYKEKVRAGLTIFDSSEVISRRHQELWLEAFYRGQDPSVAERWKILKQEADNVKSQLGIVKEKISEETLGHVSSSIITNEKKVDAEKHSRISKLFSSKIKRNGPPFARRRLHSTIHQPRVNLTQSLKKLYVQETKRSVPENIVLCVIIQCFAVGKAQSRSDNSIHVHEFLSQLSGHLQQLYVDINEKNVYWSPSRIVFRIRMSPVLTALVGNENLPNVEMELLRMIKRDSAKILVVFASSGYWDSKFFGMLKGEDNDSLFVMIETDLPIRTRPFQELQEPAPGELTGLLPISLPPPYPFIDILVRTFLRTPIYAYGFNGYFIEADDADALRLRSTHNLLENVPISVDVLDLGGGMIFRRDMLYALSSDMAFVRSMGDSDHCGCSSESLLVSAILSRNRIPRVHIPREGEFEVNRDEKAGVPREEQREAMSRCLACLIQTFSQDKVDYKNKFDLPIKSSTLASSSPFIKTSCDVPSFRSIPHIDNLPGFSFQLNWDPASSTSPCTQHLLTRYEDTSGILGVGQFMIENQSMYSPMDGEGWPFMIRLETGAKLCLYSFALVSWEAIRRNIIIVYDTTF